MGITKGPWRVDNEHDESVLYIVGKPEWPAKRYGVKGEWEVCRIDADDPNAAANAQAIAALPELVEVLREMTDALQRDGDPAFAHLRISARALLARSGGSDE